MPIIDDRGRLFGKINVIDALVVLLVVGITIAGVVFVEPFAGSEPATRHATIDFGVQESHVATLVEEGDEVSGGANELVVQDVHYDPHGEGGARVYARVKLSGRMVESETGNREFRYQGDSLRIGDEFELDTNEYSISGRVLDLDLRGRQLPVNETEVLVETVVDGSTTVEVGDVYRSAGKQVGTVESIHRYPTADPERERLQVGLSIDAIDTGGGHRFGGTPLHSNRVIIFNTRSYTFNGTVIRRGSSEPRGRQSTIDATVELRDVDPSVTRSLSVGSTEEINEKVSRVTNVTVEPATVVVESDDGQVYGRDHPRLKDVTLEMELATRQTDDRLYFHGHPIQADSTIILDFDSITVQGRITTIDR
jgi:hypothetical protein